MNKNTFNKDNKIRYRNKEDDLHHVHKNFEKYENFALDPK